MLILIIRQEKMVLVFIFFFCSSFLRPLLASNLPPRFQEWLQLVAPIITKTEKEVFLQLRTDEEREKFIRFFWKQRDPSPDTEVNEFYQEYIKRIQYADSQFGPGTGKRGSLTERGYYYLLLGPPLERHLFTTLSQLWPVELWFYKGEERYGLPPFFYLLFYQPQGQGDYRLYYPGVEGPEKLVIPSLYGQTSNREVAYTIIRKISPELASASLSLIPGEKSPSSNSLSSQTVIASVRSLPEKKFNDAYARDYLHYQGWVETDYADNYVESQFRVRFYRHGGQFFIHWACEPRKMSFAPAEAGMVYASYELVLRLEDNQGRPIWEMSQEIPLRLSQAEYESQGNRIFSFQDLFPIIPGKFTLHFLLKNKTAREFTSFSTELFVPAAGEQPELSRPLVYLSRENRPEGQRRLLQAFSFDRFRYLVNSRPEIPPGVEVGVFTQVINAPEGFWEKARLFRLIIHSVTGGEAVKIIEKNITDVLVSEGGLDSGPVSLAGVKPGYYIFEIQLLDDRGQTLTSGEEQVILLAQPYPAAPRVYSRVHPAFPDLESLKILSSQYFLAGKYAKALAMAQETLKLREEPETRLLIAKSLYALQRYQESLDILLPLYGTLNSREAAKVIALNYAGLKNWTEALRYLESLLAEATELAVLNLAAECYLQLGQPEKALPLLQKSLRLDPDQPQIKKWEEMARSQIKQEPERPRSELFSGLMRDDKPKEQ